MPKRVVEDADPYAGSAQQEAPLIHRASAVPLSPRGKARNGCLAEFVRSTNPIKMFFRRHIVRPGLLHDAAALRRGGSVSAPPFFLTKSKRLL